MVNFEMEEKADQFRNFIGKIIKQKSNDEFVGNFLRPAPSKQFKGYVYKYPDRKDESSFEKSQIM